MTDPLEETLTFLFTDIEGSTRLWQEHPDAMRLIVPRHDDILRSQVEEHGGRVFKTVGDAACAVFSSAGAALEAAVAAQRSLNAESWPDGCRIAVRMAVHTGPAGQRGGDYDGHTLNRVARILSTGHGGQTLVSFESQQLVRENMPSGQELRDLGEHVLKDLFRPEQIFQLVASGLAHDFPPLRSLDTRSNNLPIQATPFIGREKQVEEVRSLLESFRSPVLTITGPGGAGKTRLALQAAAESTDRFRGVYFVPLASVADPHLVLSTIADVLGVRESDGAPLGSVLAKHLRARSTLLLLDNFEQLLEAAPHVGRLTEASPDLRMLITSRAPLRVYGEQEYALGGLDLPDPKQPSNVAALTGFESIQLFVERARAIDPGFALTDVNAPAVARICRRLDGLPLAIELAAARVRLLPPEALLSRLESRLRLLTGGARNLPPRHQTLRAAIDWSHSLLEEWERDLFGQLAVFAAGCTVEAAEAVCRVGPDLDVLTGIESLSEKSLIVRSSTADDSPRVAMLETIREYAQERLEEQAEQGEIKRRHARYYSDLAGHAAPELHSSAQQLWLRRLSDDHDNLRAALRTLIDGGDAESAVQMAGDLWRFWWIHTHVEEARRWLEEALALPGTLKPHTRLRALTALSNALEHTGADDGRAEACLREALQIASATRDERARATVLLNLGTIATGRGDQVAASELFEESLRVARENGDAIIAGYALGNLGTIAHRASDLDRATELFEASLQVYEHVGDLDLIAGACADLGEVARDRGDWERAQSFFTRGLQLWSRLGSTEGATFCLERVAEIAFERGEPRRAAVLLGAAQGAADHLPGQLAEVDVGLRERLMESLKDRLTEPELAWALDEGGHMDPASVVDWLEHEEQSNSTPKAGANH